MISPNRGNFTGSGVQVPSRTLFRSIILNSPYMRVTADCRHCGNRRHQAASRTVIVSSSGTPVTDAKNARGAGHAYSWVFRIILFTLARNLILWETGGLCRRVSCRPGCAWILVFWGGTADWLRSLGRTIHPLRTLAPAARPSDHDPGRSDHKILGIMTTPISASQPHHVRRNDHMLIGRPSTTLIGSMRASHTAPISASCSAQRLSRSIRHPRCGH